MGVDMLTATLAIEMAAEISPLLHPNSDASGFTNKEKL